LGQVNKVDKLVKTPVTVLNFNEFDRINIAQSAIALFSGVEHYQEFQAHAVLTIKYHKELHFYVYIENFTFKSTTRINQHLKLTNLPIHKTFDIGLFFLSFLFPLLHITFTG
jgi:hypothetical protein